MYKGCRRRGAGVRGAGEGVQEEGYRRRVEGGRSQPGVHRTYIGSFKGKGL